MSARMGLDGFATFSVLTAIVEKRTRAKFSGDDGDRVFSPHVLGAHNDRSRTVRVRAPLQSRGIKNCTEGSRQN